MAMTSMSGVQLSMPKKMRYMRKNVPYEYERFLMKTFFAGREYCTTPFFNVSDIDVYSYFGSTSTVPSTHRDRIGYVLLTKSSHKKLNKIKQM